MKIFSIFLIACLIAQCAVGDAPPAEVSIGFIRAHPERCEGKKVFVMGVICYKRDATVLFLTREHARWDDYGNAIYLHPATVELEERTVPDGTPVFVTGVVQHASVADGKLMPYMTILYENLGIIKERLVDGGGSAN